MESLQGTLQGAVSAPKPPVVYQYVLANLGKGVPGASRYTVSIMRTKKAPLRALAAPPNWGSHRPRPTPTATRTTLAPTPASPAASSGRSWLALQEPPARTPTDEAADEP